MSSVIWLQKALRSVSVLLVLFRSVDRSQPRLATLDPKLVARHKGRGRLGQDSKLDFRLSIVGGKQPRTATRTKALTSEFSSFTRMLKLLCRPDGKKGKG